MDTDDPRLQPADTSDTRQDKDFTSPSEDDTQVKQDEQIVESEGVSDDVPAAADDVQVLPGSGGRDRRRPRRAQPQRRLDPRPPQARGR
jgi:hypothetical protein